MWKEIVDSIPFMLQLLLSVVLGFCVGLERKFRQKEAGIGTHTIVCFGAALIMIISKYGFGDDADSARIAAQIVSGIGFLGAGMIVYKQHAVTGLTTAAGVWATAGIGMACGAGMYVVAVFATILIIVFQCVININCKLFMNKKYYSINIKFLQTENENKTIKQLFGTDRFNHLVITRTNDQVMYNATLNTDVEYSSTKLNNIVRDYPFIISIERCDND